MDELMLKKLVACAIEARKFSYTPYTHFSVGAALLTKDEKIYTGCNIEVSTLTPTCCAERTAFSKAISEGQQDFVAIAVAGGVEGQKISKTCPPCGVCRQFMSEFCNSSQFDVILPETPDKWKVYKLSDILPLEFNL